MGGRRDGWAEEWVDRWSEGVKGVYGFSSLMKQKKKKLKITLSFASPEKEKSSGLYYLCW